ncbi:MAG: LysM peptidoglycan-binding domain-containing protein [Acidimicrobiales bacterium]
MTLERQIFELASWLLIIVCGWWTIGAALWIGALQRPHTSLRRVASAVSLPGRRRLAHAVLAAALTVVSACSSDQQEPTLVYLGSVTTSTPSMTPTPPPTQARPSTTPTTHVTPTTPSTTPPTTPGNDDPVPPASTEPTTHAEPSPVAESSTATQHEVVAGDHLWAIAAQRLTSSDQSPTNTEISGYWRRLIAANASTIRSGDPNLIYPGEVLTLPPLD